MKILVLGYFGYITNQLDGQTIKTRNIYDLLKSELIEKIEYFDTQSFQISKFNVVKMLNSVRKADVVFYLPAHNNLQYLMPLIFFISKLSRTQINYVVVGGWLAQFLQNKPMHKLILSKLKGIYVETDTLYLDLKKFGFKNIYKLHNFRIINSLPRKDIATNNNVKIVFMARIHPLKGVDLLFDLDKRIKGSNITNVCIDVFGPIFHEYKLDFLNKINNSSISYKGIINPNDIHDILSNYDLLLFPTKYYTEGFPGTILDAYIAGVPVVATDWMNAKEFIKEGYTGYITPFNEDEYFINTVISLINHPEIISNLKNNVLNYKNKYSAAKASTILKQAIYGSN